MKILKTILIIVVVGGMGYMAYDYFTTQKMLVGNITYEISGYKIIQLTAANVQIEVDITVNNPSAFSITVNQISGNLLLEGVVVGTAVNQTGFPIPGNGSGNGSILFNINPGLIKSGLLGDITGVITGQNLNVSVNGQVQVSKGIISAQIPFADTSTIKI